VRRLQPETLLKLSSRVLFATILCAGIAVASVASRLVMANSHTGQLNTAVRDMITAAKKNEDTMHRAEKMVKQNYPSGFAGVTAFRSSLEEAAAVRNVEVAEFRTGTDMIPFLTKFAKDSSEQGWFQVGVHLALHGRLSDVMACLQDLKKSDAIYEIQTLDLGRYKIDKDETIVAATVEINVVVRQQGDQS
jgi:hypothetical protein